MDFTGVFNDRKPSGERKRGVEEKEAGVCVCVRACLGETGALCAVGMGAGFHVQGAGADLLTFVLLTGFSVLWYVGGSLTVTLWGSEIIVPAYLVIAAVIYSIIVTAVMMIIGRRFTATSAAVNQAEAEFRYALTRVRENGESIALLGGEPEERVGLHAWLGNVLGSWRKLLHQHMRLTVVSNTNYELAPAIPIFLCMPKYLAGTLTLGEVTQLAAAFVSVQSAFNWLVADKRYAESEEVSAFAARYDAANEIDRPAILGKRPAQFKGR